MVLVASELGEGLPKCESGSAAPQNTRPMPMPAAKSIANHDVREYSGSASSGPKIVSPFREKADDDEQGDRQDVIPADVPHDDFRDAGNDLVDARRPDGGEDDEDQGHADRRPENLVAQSHRNAVSRGERFECLPVPSPVGLFGVGGLDADRCVGGFAVRCDAACIPFICAMWGYVMHGHKETFLSTRISLPSHTRWTARNFKFSFPWKSRCDMTPIAGQRCLLFRLRTF